MHPCPPIIVCVSGLRGQSSALTFDMHRAACFRSSEVRHAWDQTPEEVQVYIFHDNIGETWREDREECAVTISNSSVEFRFGEEGRVPLFLSMHLYQAVDAAASYYKVRKDRISIKLRKAFPGAIWPTLRAFDVMTLDEVPTLPESFKAPKEEPCAADARRGAPKGNPEDWDKMGEGAKMSVMVEERKTLEKLLGAAKMGDLQVRSRLRMIKVEKMDANFTQLRELCRLFETRSMLLPTSSRSKHARSSTSTAMAIAAALCTMPPLPGRQTF